MIYSIIIFVSFVVGFLVSNLIRKVYDRYIDKIDVDKINSIYREVLENIYKDKTFFKSRMNNSISIGTEISEGLVDVVYLMDRNDIAIFKDDACIYSSSAVDTDVVDEIIVSINIYHKKEIDDIINIFGFIFSKEYFENKFKIKVEDIKKNMNIAFGNNDNEVSDIDKIKKKNENRYDINEILDRIQLVGIENLTVSERKFLDNYNG
jgi:hypothetical protein